MTVFATEHDSRPVHRSFRLTRPGKDAVAQSAPSAVVLPERDVREMAAVAARQDVAKGGCFSAGPAGIQVWSGPWDGPLGGRGESEHLGSVDWSYDTPVLQYATVYRVLVTAKGVEAGESTESVLARVLALAGLAVPQAAAARVIPQPRDPFRSASLRQRP